MNPKVQKSMFRRLYFSPIGIFFVLLFLGLLVKANISLYHKNTLARENNDTLKTELSRYEARKAQLASALQRIDTKKGEEIALRRQFDVGNTNERLLVIVEDKTGGKGGQEEETVWETIKRYIPFLH
jgi:hypothetical protein